MRALRRCYSVEAELAIVALVVLAWQAARIPLEGNVGVSLDHAAEVLRLERALSIGIEPSIVDFASSSGAESVLRWLYTNIHLPVLFGFIAAARLLAPARYPAIRTTFTVSFVPAVFVIGLYPLAPPHWLPQFGLGVAPSEAELGTSGALFHNVTAAAASQHFGFAAFVAATAIWLFPRSRLAWLTLAYPALVFVVIVGTGNHYVLDCVVGTLTFVLAACVAWLIHRPPLATEATDRQTSEVVTVAVGCALVTWGFVSLELTMPRDWDMAPDALALIAGTALLLAPRLAAREALAETS